MIESKYAASPSDGKEILRILESSAAKGSIELPDYWKARRAVVRVNGQDEMVIDHPCEYELSYEAAHIADCLKKGLKESPVVTKSLTLRGIELLEKIK